MRTLSDAEVQHPSAAVAVADDVDMAPVGEEVCAFERPSTLTNAKTLPTWGAPRRMFPPPFVPPMSAVEPPADRRPAPVGQ